MSTKVSGLARADPFLFSILHWSVNGYLDKNYTCNFVYPWK